MRFDKLINIINWSIRIIVSIILISIIIEIGIIDFLIYTLCFLFLIYLLGSVLCLIALLKALKKDYDHPYYKRISFAVWVPFVGSFVKRYGSRIHYINKVLNPFVKVKVC